MRHAGDHASARAGRPSPRWPSRPGARPPAADGRATEAGRRHRAAAAGGSASPSAPVDREEAQLKFAQCMREHGVDMPDPVDGRIRITRRKGEEAKTEQALKKCGHLMQDAVARPRRPPIDQERRDQMVKFAQCMREHGIDMPDPRPGGRIRLRIRKDAEAKPRRRRRPAGSSPPASGKGTVRRRRSPWPAPWCSPSPPPGPAWR